MPGEVFKDIEAKEIKLSDGTGEGYVKTDANGVLSGGNSTGLDLVAEDIIPTDDNTYDLGSISKRWAAIWTVIAILTSLTVGAVYLATTAEGWLYINASTVINGSLNVTQNITAVAFFGDGSQLTGIAAGGGSSVWNSSGSNVFLNDSTAFLSLGNKQLPESPLDIKVDSSERGIRIEEKEGGSEFMFIGMNDLGNLEFVDATGVTVFEVENGGEKKIFMDGVIEAVGDPDTEFGFTGTDRIDFTAGNEVMLHIVEGGTDYVEFNPNNRNIDFILNSDNVADIFTIDGGNDLIIINENSGDVDFRIESNNNQNMLFIDGGEDDVCISCNSANATLHVAGTAIADTITVNTITADNPSLNPAYISLHTAVNMSASVGNWINITLDEAANVKKLINHDNVGLLNTSINITISGIYLIEYFATFEDSAASPSSSAAVRVVVYDSELFTFTEIPGSLKENDMTKQNSDIEISDAVMVEIDVTPTTLFIQFISDTSTVSLKSHNLFGVHPSTLVVDIFRID